MKKLIYILTALLCLTSCYKSWIVTEENENILHVGYFHDECSLGDSTSYYMSCNVNYEDVEMYFVRRTRRVLGVDTIYVADKIYHLVQDTLLVKVENYKYTPDEFKEILMEKNMTPRDTTIFQFTQDMYCTWETFDKIYIWVITKK